MMNDQRFNIVHYFYRAADDYPDKKAIIQQDKSISFAQLKGQVQQSANYFTYKGIKKGDRVLVFVPMSIDLYRIVLALFHIGATAVFLDEWVSKKRMEECCKVAQCQAFIGITKARILALFSSELRKIPIQLGTGFSKESNVLDDLSRVTKEDTALITFTTGSTGIPKATKRTHGLLDEQFKALLAKIDPQPKDVDMPVLPIVLLINLGVGCTSVIAAFNARKPEKINPKKIIAQIIKHNVTRMVSSPFVIKKISQYIINQSIDIPLVKKIFTGGAPVFPSEAAIYDKAFPLANIEIVYGSTEAEPMSSVSAKELIKNNVSTSHIGLLVGKPANVATIRIIQIQEGPIICESIQALDQISLPKNLVGEIIVSGPHVLREYIHNEDALRLNKIFIDETCWHRTGDSGFIGEDENLYLTGRCNTLVYENKKLYAPFIYENLFVSIPGVEIGTIMPYKNSIQVIIECNSEFLKPDIIHSILFLDPSFTEVVFIKKIPRDVRHHSKIDYQKLKELL